MPSVVNSVPEEELGVLTGDRKVPLDDGVFFNLEKFV